MQQAAGRTGQNPGTFDALHDLVGAGSSGVRRKQFFLLIHILVTWLKTATRLTFLSG